MGLIEKKYTVKGHRGEIYSMTAEELHKRILEDSESDYNWIAPAHSLVKVCKKPGFSEEYALDIKCAILNCFANIEHRANSGGDRYIIDSCSDKEAVWYCYNSLYGKEDEKVKQARERYLVEMISAGCVVRYFDPLFHPGPTFRKIREDLISSRFKELIMKENVDFVNLETVIHSEFVALVKKAEEEGAFDEDKKADRESWKKFYKRMAEK